MRIRSIKPEFWTSEDIYALSVDERLLFIGLWSYVDDNGVGLFRIHEIIRQLFFGDASRDYRETLRRVSDGLQHLFEQGLIEVYKEDGTQYLHITHWKKHQRVDKPNKARYPLPSNDSEMPIVLFEEQFARPSRESSDWNRGTEEQRNRYKPPIAPQGATTKNKTQRKPIPSDWQPDEAARALAAEYNIDIGKSAEKFRLWAEAKGGRLADWDKRFRLWLIGEHDQARDQPVKDSKPTPTPSSHIEKPHSHSPGCERVAALLKPYDLSHKNLNGFGSSPWIRAASKLADQLNQGIDTTQAVQIALQEAT